MPTQLHDLHSKVLTGHFSIGHLSCEFSDKFVIAANVSLVLLLIPLLNFIIYPFLREYMPNMLKRIGLGVLLAVLAQFAVLAMSGVGSRRTWINNTSHEQCMFSTNFNRSTPLVYDYSNVSEFYVLLPHLLITVAEILVNVTSKTHSQVE